MAAYVELFVDQGTTFNNIINITDDLTNDTINISGYIVTSQIRRSFYSTNITANISCSVTDASNGEITMSMTAANTANIKPGRYVFDVKYADPIYGNVGRIVEGIINITPQVTR